MPTPSSQTPRRTPPAGKPSAPRPGSEAPPRDASLPADADLLQAHLDTLVQQFELLKTQVRHAQRMASIGTTAAMLAHEFNNLFTPVVAYAQQSLDTDDVELMRIALRKTLERTGVMRQMTDRIVGLARQTDDAVKSLGVLDVVNNAIGCLCRDLGKDNIALNIQIDPGLKVRANEGQLTQVLFNLVINARQAMLGRRGRLTVDAAPVGEGMVAISVRDTGCGIAPRDLSRIFEPFFSTKQYEDKPDRRGLGLGLSICKEIVEGIEGSIDVASELNVGTTFTVTIPAGE